MTPAGFEPAIQIRQQPQTDALDRAATAVREKQYYAKNTAS
jgi:hypothetical protein